MDLALPGRAWRASFEMKWGAGPAEAAAAGFIVNGIAKFGSCCCMAKFSGPRVTFLRQFDDNAVTAVHPPFCSAAPTSICYSSCDNLMP
ncbi:MAG: hypothetical protein KKB42_03630 [Gammaproteobacteria bacterium]|nr:hypothetical protein [Gammaproteobacteria bacterium]MBU4080520.1 hypothetical protein [Gammaproteobacteria bacterium]MBU4170265.1 hypothetical protein [Gammaproteobacteria bacterium]